MHLNPPERGGKMTLGGGGVKIFLSRGLKLQKILSLFKRLLLPTFFPDFFSQVSLLLIKIQNIFRFCVALAQITDFSPLIPE